MAGKWSARLADKDSNAFDAIRLGLASLVVFEHAYFLVDNGFAREPLFRLSHGQYNSGAFAVVMFFAISGFLVTRSYLQTANFLRYLAKRLARIAPGFLVATFVGCVILAPLTAADPRAFFHAQRWFSLTAQALTLHQIGVTGILDGNAVRLIHGTLWTIKYEFDCYILIALVGLCGMLKASRAWIVYLGVLVLLICVRTGLFAFPDINHGPITYLISDPVRWPDLFPFFFAGSALYVYREHVPKSLPLCAAAIVAILVSCFTGGLFWTMLLFGSYAVVTLALSFSADLKLFGRRVDLSYGVYLYGWLIAQMLLYFSHQKLGPLTLFGADIVLSFLAAFASWKLVEYPALRLVKGRKV